MINSDLGDDPATTAAIAGSDGRRRRAVERIVAAELAQRGSGPSGCACASMKRKHTLMILGSLAAGYAAAKIMG